MKVYSIRTNYGKTRKYISDHFVTENFVEQYKENKVKTLKANGYNREITFDLYDTRKETDKKGKYEILCYTKEGLKTIRVKN